MKKAEINLKECVERKVEERYHFGKTLKFITHFLNVEQLFYPGEEIKHIRRTILFSKKRENELGNFCDVDIIDTGDNFLVTCCEHMYVKMKFKEGEVNLGFDGVLVSGNLKCFLLSKDDMYVAYLLQHMALTSQGAICTLLDSRIDNVLLTSTLNLKETVKYSKAFVVKQLMNILNTKEIDSSVLNWNKHMADIEPKTIKVLDNVKNIIYRYDANVIPDSLVYKKEVIPEEDVAMLTILQETTGEIFENTPISNVVPRKMTLPVGAQILVKNENYRATIYLESIDSSCDLKITTSFEMTTDIRVSLYIPIGAVCDFQKHFFEETESVSYHQLYEIFKKVVREKFGEKDLLNAF